MTRGRSSLLALPVLAASALAASSAAGAEDTGDVEALLDEAVVSSASKTAETAHEAPGTTLSLDSEEMRRYGLRTLDEAVNFLAMGMMVENKLSTSELNSRGVLLTGDYGTHVLVMLDGHALNEEWDGTTYFDRNLAVPFEMIDRIELVLGPGSVLYGSHAMLGVINVITKKAKDWPGVHVSLEGAWPLGGRAALGYARSFTLGGYKGEVTAQVEYWASRGPALDYGLQGYGLDSVTGLPKQFSSEGPGTGVWGGRSTEGSLWRNTPAAYLKASLGDFELAFRVAQSRYWNPHSYGDFSDEKAYEGDQWISLDLRWSRRLSSLAHLAVRLYGDSYLYDFKQNDSAPEDCMDGQTSGCSYVLQGAPLWGGVEAVGTFDWLSDGRFLTLVGVDARARQVDSNDAYEDWAGELAPVATSYSKLEGAVGAYLSVIARPLSWLAGNVGARLDWDSRFGVHVSPRAAVTVTPWTGGALKVVYSEAFRAPTAYETYFADSKTQIAPKDLKAEVVRSVEGSIEQQIAGQRLHVGAFYSEWSDLIATGLLTAEEVQAALDDGQLDPNTPTDAPILQYRNMAQVKNAGFEASLSGSLLERKLRWGLSFTWAQAREILDDGSEASLPAAAPWFGNARISWAEGGSIPVVSLAVRFVAPRPVADTLFDPVPEAPAQVEIRVAVVGQAAFWLGSLSYGLVGSYSTADHGAYSVGPLREPYGTYTAQALLPLPQFQAGLQLRYDF